MRLPLLVFLLLAAPVLGGCASYTVLSTTRADQVYVLRQKLGASDRVYSCDARGGEPVCTRAREVR